MKMLYKYPQSEFPYEKIVAENRNRNKLQPEFELMDTGIFNEDKYFDIFIEYAKQDESDILIKISAFNRGSAASEIQVIPQLWFRNTWSWGYDQIKPQLRAASKNEINITHKELGNYHFFANGEPELIFCENETNTARLSKIEDSGGFYKDGINDYIVNKNKKAINPDKTGTKAGARYVINVPAGKSETIQLRLSSTLYKKPFAEFEEIFETKTSEANSFYQGLQSAIENEDAKKVQRQALAGMLWSKQFYYFDIPQWLNGDPSQASPPEERKNGRNSEWSHLNNADIISMPDTWEYPWYAAWDLAFHCIPLAMIDPQFAKDQLKLLTREWYMHPNGQFPAYEWSFSDVTPPRSRLGNLEDI